MSFFPPQSGQKNGWCYSVLRILWYDDIRQIQISVRWSKSTLASGFYTSRTIRTLFEKAQLQQIRYVSCIGSQFERWDQGAQTIIDTSLQPLSPPKPSLVAREPTIMIRTKKSTRLRLRDHPTKFCPMIPGHWASLVERRRMRKLW